MQSKDFYRNMWDSLLRDGPWSGELWNRTKSGELYPEMFHIHAIRDADGRVKQFVGLFTDITEVKEHEQQLELAAHYDVLTGLPNRALLADRLRQAMAQARRRNQLLGRGMFRSRRLQGHQRQPRPLQRRRAADRRGLQDEAGLARGRHAGAAGRRRVRCRDSRSARSVMPVCPH